MTKTIIITCVECLKIHGEFLVKQAPKSFICVNCGLAQQLTDPPTIGSSRKRNYPLGFFDAN